MNIHEAITFMLVNDKTIYCKEVNKHFSLTEDNGVYVYNDLNVKAESQKINVFYKEYEYETFIEFTDEMREKLKKKKPPKNQPNLNLRYDHKDGVELEHLITGRCKQDGEVKYKIDSIYYRLNEFWENWRVSE